jgi:hypothetical protein
MTDRYWVGGTGNWNSSNTANWSPAGVPTSSDRVFFNSASSGADYAVTVAGTRSCLDIDISGPGASSNVTFNFNSGSSINCYGSWVNTGGYRVILNGTSSSTINFRATTAGQTIDTGGVSFSNLSQITFNGVGGEWTLMSGINAGFSTQIVLTSGALNLNNQVVTAYTLSSSGSGTRSINFGSSGYFSLFGLDITVVTFATSTNFSYTGTSRINVEGFGSPGETRTITGPTSTTGTEGKALNIYVTNGSDTVTVGTNNRYYRTLDFTGFTGTIVSGSDFTLFGDLVIPSNVTYGATPASGLIFASTNATTRTITTPGRTFNCPLNFDGVGGTWAFQNALTMASTKALSLTNGTLKLQSGTTSVVGSFLTPGTNQVYLQATTSGTQATISAASGINTATNINIQDSNATGGAFWRASNALNAVDAGNNSGWTFIGWYVIPNNQSSLWTQIPNNQSSSWANIANNQSPVWTQIQT